MKVGLISDVHATPAPLKEALALFRQHNVDMIICAGDIAGYGEELEQTVELLIESECKTITGNHDVWYLNDPAQDENKRIKDFFSALPKTLDFSAAGKQVYVVHASPPHSMMKGIDLLDMDARVNAERKSQWVNTVDEFDFDVLIVGHTHQVFAEKLGKTLVINPGSTKFNHTCTILTLPELTVELLPLSNKEIVKTWNWSKWNKA